MKFGIKLTNHPGGGFGLGSKMYWLQEFDLGVIILYNNENAFYSDYSPGKAIGKFLEEFLVKKGVAISFIFRSLIMAQVYGDEERAKLYYSKIGEEDWPPGKQADACIECGECKPKCPQKIEIIDQLKKAHKVLS